VGAPVIVVVVTGEVTGVTMVWLGGTKSEVDVVVELGVVSVVDEFEVAVVGLEMVTPEVTTVIGMGKNDWSAVVDWITAPCACTNVQAATPIAASIAQPALTAAVTPGAVKAAASTN
jgi:hypothetical protein